MALLPSACRGGRCRVLGKMTSSDGGGPAQAALVCLTLPGGAELLGGADLPAAIAEELEDVFVVFADRIVVADADERGRRAAEELIEAFLVGHVQGARGFVEHDVFRLGDQYA